MLICGDVFFNMHLLTTMPGLRQPPGPFTFDPPLNRRSERKLAELEPRVAGFGHGPVLTDGTAAKERLRGRAATDADRPLEAEGVRLRVLELLRERDRLTNAEIRSFSGYSRQQVLGLEKDLVREGMVEMRGHGRGAHIVLASAPRK